MVDRQSGTHPQLLPVPSVRITSKASYNNALVVADFWRFAHGPTVWPAFWGEFFVLVYGSDLILISLLLSAVGYVLRLSCVVRYTKLT